MIMKFHFPCLRKQKQVTSAVEAATGAAAAWQGNVGGNGNLLNNHPISRKMPWLMIRIFVLAFYLTRPKIVPVVKFNVCSH